MSVMFSLAGAIICLFRSKKLLKASESTGTRGFAGVGLVTAGSFFTSSLSLFSFSLLSYCSRREGRLRICSALSTTFSRAASCIFFFRSISAISFSFYLLTLSLIACSYFSCRSRIAIARALRSAASFKIYSSRCSPNASFSSGVISGSSC